MPSIRHIRKRGGVLITLLAVCCQAGVAAAADFTFRPELAIARIYDDNLFFTADGEGVIQRDALTRVSPVLGAELTSPTWDLAGRLGVEAEEYNENEALDSDHNRRFAAVSLDVQGSEKLGVSAGMNYTETMTPGEFNLASGLQPGRINASRAAVNPALVYRFSERTTGTLELQATRDRLDGGVQGDTREAALQVEQAMGDRNLLSYGYRYRHYRFTRSGLSDVVSRTHLPKLGWTHRLSARTGITLEAGPRISRQSTKPYYLVEVGHEYDNGIFEINYARDEVALVGESGRFETETAGINVTYRLGPNVELNIMPGYGRVRSATTQAEVARVDFNMDYRINNYLNFITSYKYYDFRGTGFDPSLERTLSRNVFLMGIEMQYPGENR